MEKHLPNILAGLWGLALCIILLGLSALVRPSNKGKLKNASYDSGEMPTSKPWVRITARYHRMLVAAVLFVVAMLFMFPAASAFRNWIEKGAGVQGLGEIGLFLFVLTIALAYSWKKGHLNWHGERDE